MKLLEVQIAALKACNGAVGFGYWMEMGLGKTLTAQADLLDRLAEGKANRSVVVCPNSFKGGWVKEAEKWNLPINQVIYNSGSNYHETWLRQPSNQIRQLIINYEAIRSEGTMSFLKSYMETHKTFLVFDESIQISTHNALQTRAAIELAKSAVYSRTLSGKPMKQGPHDFWSQFRAMKLFEGKSYYPFKTTFCKMGGWKMKQVLGAQNEEYLGTLIDPHVFRATKDVWTDLPPKTWTVREYKLTPKLKAMYDSMQEEFVLWINNTEVVTVDAAITKYIKLAQIQCGWIYDEQHEVRQLVPDDENPRLKLLLDTIEMEVMGKVAIPYRHKPVFHQLLRALGGPTKCAWITGGMRPEEIEEQKRRFNEDRSVRFILLQTAASKYGHSLLGLPEREHWCCTMIPYENTYSLDDRSQIEDRIHRHGQIANSVLYLDLVGTPLDRDAVAALQRKENVFQAIMAHVKRRR